MWLARRQKIQQLTKTDFWEAFRRQPKQGPLQTKDDFSRERRDENRPQNSPEEIIRGEGVEGAVSTDKNKEMKSINLSFSNQVFIFSSIRYCQMSPMQLKEARIALRLDALLVDGLLRKLLGTQMRHRLIPWKV